MLFGLKLTTVVVLLWYLRPTVSQCHPAEYGAVLSYGESCQYKCRCRNNEQCDSFTGYCPSGCEPGWMGPGCQYANLALNKPTTQKKNYEDKAEFGPSMAVDGDESTCSKQAIKKDGRWCVDLGEKRHVVGLIMIVPAQDPVVLDGYIIYVSNESYAEWEKLGICYWQEKPPTNDVSLTHYEIMCFQPFYGQFIVIHKRTADVTHLTLCEVQVYGGRELAFRKPSVQTSTLQQLNTGPEKAVNGRAVASDILQCSATTETKDPSWQVDLGRVFTIYRLILRNVEDEDSKASLKGFEVVISKGPSDDNAVIYIHEKETIEVSTEVNLPRPADGRYITIRLLGEGRQLVLCEVDVFGDCPVNQCNLDCSDNCWCNNTLTGEAQLSGVCSYKCSKKADPNSKPKCNIAFDSITKDSDSEADGENQDQNPNEELGGEYPPTVGPFKPDAETTKTSLPPPANVEGSKTSSIGETQTAKEVTVQITTDSGPAAMNPSVYPTTVDTIDKPVTKGKQTIPVADIQITTVTAEDGVGSYPAGKDSGQGEAGPNSINDKSKEDSDRVSSGKLVGIIFGCIALVLIGGTLIFMLMNMLRKRKRHTLSHMPTHNLPANITAESTKEPKAYENPIFMTQSCEENDTKV